MHFYQEQERKDGVTGDGRPVTDLTENREGEVCTKCGNVGEQLLTCSVRYKKIMILFQMNKE